MAGAAGSGLARGLVYSASAAVRGLGKSWRAALTFTFLAAAVAVATVCLSLHYGGYALRFALSAWVVLWRAFVACVSAVAYGVEKTFQAAFALIYFITSAVAYFIRLSLRCCLHALRLLLDGAALAWRALVFCIYAVLYAVGKSFKAAFVLVSLVAVTAAAFIYLSLHYALYALKILLSGLVAICRTFLHVLERALAVPERIARAVIRRLHDLKPDPVFGHLRAAPVRSGLIMSVATLSMLHFSTDIDVMPISILEETRQEAASVETVTIKDAKTDTVKVSPSPSSAAPTMDKKAFRKETQAAPKTALIKRVPIKKEQREASYPPDIRRGNPGDVKVSITFDGGSRANEATAILGALRERGIQTTIFLTGEFIKDNPGLVITMVTDGHEIANHMMSHPHLTSYGEDFRHRTLPGVTKEFMASELRETADIFTAVTGERMAPLWRAPYGEVNGELREWAYQEGYIHIGWTSDYRRRESLDTLDWVYDRTSELYLTSEEIRDKIFGFGRDRGGLGGGIILMHLGTERAEDRPAGRLGEILDGVMERGYTFVKVSTLIGGSEKIKALLRQPDKVAMRLPKDTIR